MHRATVGKASAPELHSLLLRELRQRGISLLELPRFLAFKGMPAIAPPTLEAARASVHRGFVSEKRPDAVAHFLDASRTLHVGAVLAGWRSTLKRPEKWDVKDAVFQLRAARNHICRGLTAKTPELELRGESQRGVRLAERYALKTTTVFEASEHTDVDIRILRDRFKAAVRAARLDGAFAALPGSTADGETLREQLKHLCRVVGVSYRELTGGLPVHHVAATRAALRSLGTEFQSAVARLDAAPDLGPFSLSDVYTHAANQLGALAEDAVNPATSRFGTGH